MKYQKSLQRTAIKLHIKLTLTSWNVIIETFLTNLVGLLVMAPKTRIVMVYGILLSKLLLYHLTKPCFRGQNYECNKTLRNPFLASTYDPRGRRYFSKLLQSVQWFWNYRDQSVSGFGFNTYRLLILSFTKFALLRPFYVKINKVNTNTQLDI